MNVQWMDIR